MGTISARKAMEIIGNLTYVLAIDFRIKDDYKLGSGTESIFRKVRRVVPYFEEDQEFNRYVEKIYREIRVRNI